MKPETCDKCGKVATWAYMPSTENYCDKCVPRGCECNVIDDVSGEQYRDEQNRLLPCCEYVEIKL